MFGFPEKAGNFFRQRDLQTKAKKAPPARVMTQMRIAIVKALDTILNFVLYMFFSRVGIFRWNSVFQ